jgi:hypothetical protein
VGSSVGKAEPAFDHSSLNSVEGQQDQSGRGATFLRRFPLGGGESRGTGGPTGANAWPFLNTDDLIKVEEFIEGDHLVVRAELP